MSAAELAEKLESFASEQDEKADVETNRAMRVGFGNEAKLLRQAAALISAQAAEIARLEEAAGEVWDEAYNEGACDTAGWEKETAHAVLQWLDKEGDGFDINHPDGNTTDAIIQGLYDAKRSGNLAELRQAAARLRSMEKALKEIGVALGTHPLTGRHARHNLDAVLDTVRLSGKFDEIGRAHV